MRFQPETLHCLRASVIFAFSFVTIGCASSVNFDIAIRNATTRPVEISLAKQTFDGSQPGPYEPEWATPEDVASRTVHVPEKWDGPLIPPGRTARRTVQGHFNAETRGVVRCYWGEMTISQMMARNEKSPDRVDIPLRAGSNVITLVDRDGRLAAE